MPIRLKLSLWYSGILFLFITLFCTYLYLFFTHREMNQIDSHLSERALEVHQSIRVIDIFPFPMQRLVLPDIDVFSSPEIFLQVINQDGNIVTRSESLGEKSLPVSKLALERILEGKSFFETKSVGQAKLRIFYFPLMAKGQLIGFLQVAESLYGFQRSLDNLQMLLALGVITTTTLSGLIGWVLARKALNPIHRIIETTAGIEREGNLEKRISYDGPNDEIGQLSHQINSMMEKIERMYSELEESYETQRRFVADASHELRTPLTSIRGNIDFIRKLYLEKGIFSMEAMEDIIDEIERVSRMIHNLLALARADAGYKVQMEEISLKDWFSDWIGQVKNMAGPHVHFTHDSLNNLEGVHLLGNRDFLKQILIILMDNAFKYTAEGTVHLGFDVSLEHNSIKMIVEDTGAGIPPEELSHVFDRFYRGANVRNKQGTGLGLSIAKWIAEKHGGSIVLHSTLGKGTRVEVTLPLL